MPKKHITAQKNLKPTQAVVRELLDYSPMTGNFRWKRRKRKWFKSYRDWNAWNTRYAGKRAFTTGGPKLYSQGDIFGTAFPAHRIAFLWMTGRWPEPETDHINGIRNDNRWSNLREVTVSQNQLNR